MRPPGTPNKPRQAILRKLKALLGDDFNPVVEMAQNAYGIQQMVNTTYGDAFQREAKEYSSEEMEARKAANTEWNRCAEFLQPKLRAVEVSGVETEDEEGNPVSNKLVVEVVSVQKTQNS